MSAVEQETAEICQDQVRLNFRTGPGFRFPAHIRTSKGSRLKIHSNGSITYHNPDFAPKVARFKLSPLRAREDGDLKTFERLKSEIEKRAAADKVRNLERYIGRPCGDGYHVVATDGHTALCQLGPGTGEDSDIFKQTFADCRKVCTISDPEFHLALKRSLTVQPENSRKVRLIGTPGKLSLTSYDKDWEHPAEFEETLNSDNAETWYAAFDPKFLEHMCGAWPIAVLYQHEAAAAVFEFGNGLFRYVVMPIRDEFNPADFVPAEIEQTEISNGPDQTKIQEATCVF